MDSSQKIELAPVLDLAYADKLKELLLTALAAGNDIWLDAGKVDRITTPCLQLFVAVARELSENGGSFKITQASEAVVTALKDIGLEEIYQKWSEEE